MATLFQFQKVSVSVVITIISNHIGSWGPERWLRRRWPSGCRYSPRQQTSLENEGRGLTYVRNFTVASERASSFAWSITVTNFDLSL